MRNVLLQGRLAEAAAFIRERYPVNEMPTFEEALEIAEVEYYDAHEVKDEDKMRKA